MFSKGGEPCANSARCLAQHFLYTLDDLFFGHASRRRVSAANYNFDSFASWVLERFYCNFDGRALVDRFFAHVHFQIPCVSNDACRYFASRSRRTRDAAPAAWRCSLRCIRLVASAQPDHTSDNERRCRDHDRANNDGHCVVHSCSPYQFPLLSRSDSLARLVAIRRASSRVSNLADLRFIVVSPFG